MKKKLMYAFLIVVILILLFIAYFFSIRHFDQKILESTEVQTIVKLSETPNLLLPTYFLDGERFYFKIPTSGNDTLLAFGDTGGGVSFLMPKAKKNKAIRSKLKTGIIKGIMPVKYILFDDLGQDSNFPKPNPRSKLIVRNPFLSVKRPILIIPPIDDELKLMMNVQPEMDVFLSQTFFMDHAWTFDYQKQQVYVNTPLNDTLINHPNVQKLGFKKNENNQKLFGHPSMTIEVDGETIDVLFDSGATMIPSEEGKKRMSTDKKTLGGSFIAASIYDKWRKEHPEWTHYPKADLVGDIIEVPIVKIGEYEVGPVLFAVRRDEVWSNGMINTMDKVVKGAIGGSVLKYFKVTVDYNSELIRFEK
jgi:hypothetical protein